MSPHRDIRRLRPIFLAASCVAALAACGSNGEGNAGTATSAAAAVAPLPTSGCGSLPAAKLNQVDDALAELPESHRREYRGMGVPTRKSPWVDWKPSHGPPYRVSIIWGAVSTDFQQRALSLLKKNLLDSGIVSSVDAKNTLDVNVAQQLQFFNAAIANKPDLIIVEPMLPESFPGAIERAAKAGIPTLTLLGAVDTPSAVNLNINGYAAGALTAARAMVLIGKRGNVMKMGGVPGFSADIEVGRAWDDVLAKCPEAKVVGQTAGIYTVSTAQSQTLKFLATHPQKIDAVLQTAVMAPGVMAGFKQSGRPMPVVPDVGNMAGSLAYWLQHRGTYHSIGTGLGAPSLALSATRVAVRMLRGDGVKVNNVVKEATTITDKNLDEWAKPGVPLNSTAIADGPDDGFMTDAYLDAFFVRSSSSK